MLMCLYHSLAHTASCRDGFLPYVMHSDALQVSLSADLSGLLSQQTPIMTVKGIDLGFRSC